MNANLNVASSKMSAMLCCSGEKDSAGVGRDLKSAQNTPSRQPMQPPYTMGTGQFMAQQPPQQQFMQQQFRQQQQQNMYGPPPLSSSQPGHLRPPHPPGPGSGGPMNPSQQPPPPPPGGPMGPGMNNYTAASAGVAATLNPGSNPVGLKDDYRKVHTAGLQGRYHNAVPCKMMDDAA